MTEKVSSDSRAAFAHDARQCLNAIRLTAANLRMRLSGLLGSDDREWLLAKLEKIDRRVDRLCELLDPQQ